MLLLNAISWSLRHPTGRRVIMASLVLLITLCVLSIFFFPSHQGPYAATHGPVTELRALMAPASLFLALVLLTLGWFRPTLDLFLAETRHVAELRLSIPSPSSLYQVFRC